jgi:hypothetical protein
VIFVLLSQSNEKNWTTKNGNTASPLSYIIQAAMGQCSTLPSEARNEATNTHPSKPYGREQPPNYNMPTNQSSENSTTPLTRRQRVPDNTNGYHLQVQTVNQQSPTPIAQFSHMAVHQVQPNSPQQRQYMEESSVFHTEEERDACPPPPDSATRTRCYKLNLDSEFVGVTSVASTDGHLLGPFDGNVPPLTYSSSGDSSFGYDSTDVVIQTAQIFRGITVANDGTILSQNARATRSNKGKKNQKGEQSRQAAKIVEAKDLVEESILTGKVSYHYVPFAKSPKLHILTNY